MLLLVCTFVFLFSENSLYLASAFETIVALPLVYCIMLLNYDTICIINIHQIIYHNMA